jgi:hypothetical protein
MKSIRLKERDVAKQIRDFLEWHGWRTLRWNIGVMTNEAGAVVRFGEKGTPDLMFVYYFLRRKPGAALVLWVETKRQGADLRDSQIEWQFKETKRGALIVTVDNYEEFRDWYLESFEWLHDPGGIGEGQGKLPLKGAKTQEGSGE